MYQLAQKYGTQVRDIVEANRILEDRPLLPGQLLQVPLSCSVVDGELGFGTQVLDIWVDGLQARCPWLEAEVLTHTADGRPLTLLRLGRGRRKVMMAAAQHANEYITGILLMQMLECYCHAIGQDQSLFGFPARSLFHGTTLYMIPLANPGGVDLVTGEIVAGHAEYEAAKRLSRTNSNVPFPSGWKANLQGTDLNLNYPAAWDTAKAVKTSAGVTSPGPRDYAGERPLDQPETAAVASLIRRICPHALAAWHTQGGEIYADDACGNLPDEDLARRLACASGYELKPVPQGSRGGGLRDWFVEEFHRPGFTIEAGRGQSPLPLSDLPLLFEENLPIFALLLAG